MKALNIVEVKKVEENKVVATVKKDFGSVKIKRIVRKHTKEIRELQQQGIYCFEIQGILYWYKEQPRTDIMVEYKEPEDFRSSDRTTNNIKKGGRKSVERKAVKKTVQSKETSSIVLETKKEEPKQKAEPKKVELKKEQSKEIKHEKYEQIKMCIENDIPVYLTGEAGSGKNYTLEQIAWELGLDFYFTNSVQQEYKLTGFIDAGGAYHETEFYKAFKNGGMFFLDEIDASIPEVLVLLNAAIANRYFEFPNGRIEAHKDFRVVAAGNTVGSGADEMYTGRLVLDQATLDRFAIIEFNYDKNVEMKISNDNEELVEFVEAIRTEAKENGIRATFSYRCIEMVTKLEKAGMDIKTILQIAVFKGLDKDTINTFYQVPDSKYAKALREIQAV